MADKTPFIRKTMVFVLAALFLGQYGGGVFDLILSNFLRDSQNLVAEQRGMLELPRELPGILSLFAVSALFLLNEVRIAAVSCLLMCLGAIALAFLPSGSGILILSMWIMTVSLGQHILMGTVDSIVMHTSSPENRSLRLGQMKALTTAASLLGALVIWIKWKFNTSFSVDYLIMAGHALPELFASPKSLLPPSRHEKAGNKISFSRNVIKFTIGWKFYTESANSFT